MSIMNDITVTCPSCEEQITVTLAESVNADRRPDLRQEIIEGTFQVVACSGCGTEFMLDPVLNYLDMERGQWFSVQPAQRLGDWMAVEDEASATMAGGAGHLTMTNCWHFLKAPASWCLKKLIRYVAPRTETAK